MTDHSGESGEQRTVAELLKQYGGDGSGGGRRRRRSAEPDDEPSAAPQPPTQRSDGEDPLPRRVPGEESFRPVEETTQAAPWASANGANGSGPDTTGSTGTGGFESFGYDTPNGPAGYDAGYGSSYDSGYGADPASGYDPNFGASTPASGLDSTGTGWTGTGGFPSAGTGGYSSVTGSGGYPGVTGSGGYPSQPGPTGTGGFQAGSYYQGDIYQGGSSAPSRPPAGGEENPTDFIPRYSAAPGAQPGPPGRVVPGRSGTLGDSGPATDPGTESGPSTAVSSRAEMFDDEEPIPGGRATDGRSSGDRSTREADEDLDDLDDDRDDEPDGDPDEDTDDVEESGRGRRRRRRSSGGDAPAGLDPEESDLVEQERRRPDFKTWLSLIGQWLLGAVGGAALWVGFRYLWLNFPVVALGAAVLATAGLVLLVRAIRRSDDLQTTMLAILVGLVVTISPAVLLLAVR